MKTLFFIIIISILPQSVHAYDFIYSNIDANYLQNSANNGYSIASSSDWLFVGIPGYDLVRPRPLPSIIDAGAVDVYRKDQSGNWVYFQRILPSSSAGNYAKFGSSIDTDDNNVIIGAPGAWDNKGFASLYTFDGYSWNLTLTFKPGTQYIQDNFGFSVAIDGNCVAIGTPGKDKWDSVNQINYSNFGEVKNYLLVNGSYTSLGTKSFTNFSVGNGQLGFSVDVFDAHSEWTPGCRIIAGAPYAKDENGYTRGAHIGYLIKDNGIIYDEATATFGFSNSSEHGYSVSLDCTTVMVLCGLGSPQYVINNTYCNAAVGEPNDSSFNGIPHGAITSYSLRPNSYCNPYSYNWNGGGWLYAYNYIPPAGSRLGHSVSFVNGRGIGGAPGYNDKGSVYLYGHGFDNHSYVYNIVDNPNQQTNSKFGFSVSVPMDLLPSESFNCVASSPYYTSPYPSSYYSVGKSYYIEEI